MSGVTVTQADRVAAADYLIAAYPEAIRDARVKGMRGGARDYDPAVKAFARHRIEAYLEGARGMQEAAAEAAMNYRAWVNWTGDTFPDEPGTTIRALDADAMLRARNGGGE